MEAGYVYTEFGQTMQEFKISTRQFRGTSPPPLETGSQIWESRYQSTSHRQSSAVLENGCSSTIKDTRSLDPKDNTTIHCETKSMKQNLRFGRMWMKNVSGIIRFTCWIQEDQQKISH